MNTFYQQYQIPLDPVYTGKMLFGIFDLIKKKQWRWGKQILAIHTGGLQGGQGMNRQLQKKGILHLTYAKDLLCYSFCPFFCSCGSSRKVVIRVATLLQDSCSYPD